MFIKQNRKNSQKFFWFKDLDIQKRRFGHRVANPILIKIIMRIKKKQSKFKRLNNKLYEKCFILLNFTTTNIFLNNNIQKKIVQHYLTV